MSTRKQLRDSDKIMRNVRRILKKADRIVIGAGSGLSSSAGLDYNDTALFNDGFQPFAHKGYSSITKTLPHFWQLTEENATKYWGYWAHHIQKIYFEPGPLETYEKLYDIIRDKDFYVVTTNTDGQFFKGLFNDKKVFAMQGSYGKFQCQKACHSVLYDDWNDVQKMMASFDSRTLEINVEDVPRCPMCGGLMAINLRMDQHFVETDAMINRRSYMDFIDHCDGKTVFLELGVGYNTPQMIKYPFEEMAEDLSATLIRINKGNMGEPDIMDGNVIAINSDIDVFFDKLN